MVHIDAVFLAAGVPASSNEIDGLLKEALCEISNYYLRICLGQALGIKTDQDGDSEGEGWKSAD